MMNRTLRNLLGMLLSTALLLGCAATQLHRDGLAEVERGNYEAGVSKLSEAVAQDPQNMMFRLDLTARREDSIQKLISAGDALRATGQYDTAVSTYRRVLAIEAGNQRALHGIDAVETDRRHAGMVGDQPRDASVNMPELEPQEGSVTCWPVSRYTIQSLSMPRLAASRRISGRCRPSQRSRAGEVIETQSPASA